MNTTCVVCQHTYSDLANELNVQEICTECERAGWIEAPEPPQSRRFVIEVEVEGPNEPFSSSAGSNQGWTAVIRLSPGDDQ